MRTSAFKQWRDIYCASFGEADVDRQPDQAFSARSEFMQIGEISLIRFDATLQRVARSQRQVASDLRDDFVIGFSHGGPQSLSQRGRQVTGPSAFFTNGEAIESRMRGRSIIVGLCVPRARVMELVAGAEDLIAQSLGESEAARHLDRYARFLLSSGTLPDQGPLVRKIDSILLDLVALSLGTHRDRLELAKMRGLRAARAQAIIAAIEAGFSDPAFSVHTVASKLRLKPHYVQNILTETGMSFAERVLEQRMQKARAMLADPRHDRLRISELAYACGFNEVSYFNRCFRRRFGASPTQFRS